MKVIRLIALLLIPVLLTVGLAQSRQEGVPVYPRPSFETVLAVADFQPKQTNPAESALLNTINSVLWEDLKFSGFFKMASKSYYPLKPIADPGAIHYADWKEPRINADFLVVGSVDVSQDELVVEGWVADVKKGAQAFGKRIRGGRDQTREVAHKLADIIVFNLTAGASRGIATTKIAFESKRGASKEIYIMDYDGFNQTPLTKNGSINLAPDWSSDNTKIAFTSLKSGQPEINIVSAADGARVSFPTFNSFAATPAFSPDGSRVAFALRNPTTKYIDIYVSNASGGERLNLTNSRSINISPCWSPSGKQLAFISDRSGSPQIYAVDSDGANLKRVLSEGGHADSPSWSPDGRFIAFTWLPKKGMFYDVYLIELATGKIFQVTSENGNNQAPSWSPDGRHIVFQSDRTGTNQIHTMLVDGTEQRQLTKAGVNTNPAWSRYYN